MLFWKIFIQAVIIIFVCVTVGDVLSRIFGSKG